MIKIIFYFLSLFLLLYGAKTAEASTWYTLLEGDRCLTDQGQIITDPRNGDLIRCQKDLVCLPNKDPAFPYKFACQKGSSTSAIFGFIEPPKSILDIGVGSFGVSQVVNVFIQLLFIAASILFVVMILISALQWIISGGDKEGISKARSRLTHAIIGLILLAFAFVIMKLLGQILGFTFFT